MNLSQLNTATLRQMLKLSEKKELLLKEINKIDASLEDLFKGNTTLPVNLKASSPTQPKAKQRAPKAQRRMIKESIMKALKEAGPIGIKVNELSKKLGVKNSNLHVWFSNVGKKIEGLEKIAPGHFCLHHKEEKVPTLQPSQEIQSSQEEIKQGAEIKQEPLSLY